MKKLKSYLANQLILLVGIVIILSSCKKESKQVIEKSTLDSKQSGKEINNLKVLDLEHSIAKSLAKIYASNSNFKKALENLCLKQKHGDYYIRLSEIFSENSLQKLASPDQIKSITSLTEQMKATNSGREPIVFIPSVENLDPTIIKDKIAVNSINGSNSSDTLKKIQKLPPETDQTIYVFGENGGQNNELYPGYTMDQSGSLTYYGMISESFAWNNPVIVLGVEEESSYNPDDDDINPASLNPIKALDNRNPSRLEIGGRILVTDIKEIEPWIYGKLEMKYFVNSSSGTSIKERAFAPIRRADINNVWLNLNDPIGHWDVNVWGPQQYERWIEEDGGGTTTITTSVTPVAGGPSYTITNNLKKDDDDCGLAAVGYNDTFYGEVPLTPSEWTIYYISYMNFQRYSQYQQ